MNRKRRAENHGVDEEGKKRKDEDGALAVLQNPDILETVFKHFDFTRLKIFRTVCKAWNEEICRELRNRSETHVPTQEDYGTLMELLSRSKTMELPMLIQNLVICIRGKKISSDVDALSFPLPVTKLYTSEFFTVDDKETASNLHKILSNCCSTLTHLKIPFCNDEVPDSGSPRPELEFPLLEELCLIVTNRKFDKEEEDDNRQDEIACYSGAFTFFSKLIDSAPKLTSLEIIDLAAPVSARILETFKIGKVKNFKIWSTNERGLVGPVVGSIKFDNVTSLSLASDYGAFSSPDVTRILSRHAESLESLNLNNIGPYIPLCPNVKTLTLQDFSNPSWDLSSFPSLNTLRIGRVDVSLRPNLTHTCPASVKRVEIVFGQKFPRIKESMRKLYKYFANSVTTWELPYEYVKHFCNYICHEKASKGVRSVAIGFDPLGAGFNSLKSPELAVLKRLEDVTRLKDLEELSLINSNFRFCRNTWGALDKEKLPNLRSVTHFIHGPEDFAELANVVSKFEPLEKVVLLCNRPVSLDRKAEEFFAALPHATLDRIKTVFIDMHHADGRRDWDYEIESGDDLYGYCCGTPGVDYCAPV